MTKDRVYQLQDGWYCVIDGRTFGPWACREYAKAGMETERRRAARRYIRNTPWTPRFSEDPLERR